MAKLTPEELIEAFKEMTLIEASEFRTLLLRLLLLLLVLLVATLLPLLKRRTSLTLFSKTLALRRSA